MKEGKLNNILIGVTGGVILAIILYFIIQKGKIEKSKNINSNLEEDKNNDLKKHIDNLHTKVNEIINKQPDINEATKLELKKLLDNYHNIDEEVRAELISAKLLMDIKQNSKAILSLVKIIENLLKKKYKNNKEFKIKFKKRNPVLDNYIEFANEKKDINKKEYHFMKAIKEIRNKEAHEVGVKLNPIIGAKSILLSLQLIFRLSRL